MTGLPDQFETERLRMRRTTVDEALALLEGRVPPGLKFGEGYPTPMALEVADLLAGARTAEAPGFVSYFMMRKADGRVIGEIGGSPGAGDGHFTVGYGVSAAVEGKGYTTEALRGLLAALFAAGVTRVEADTFVGHTASRRVMEKAGMRFVEEFEREEDGAPARLVLYRADHSPT